MDAIVRKQQGVPDPDAPSDAASTRFWCFTGGKFTDRESTSIEMEATATVQTSAAALGSMLDAGSSAGGTPSTLALTNGEAGAAPSASTVGPSLEDLVGVMQGHVAAKAKAKATSKAKAKARAVQQQGSKTPQEIREAIRILLDFLTCFLGLGA